MYYGVFAIDNFHIVGGHFPDVSTTGGYTDINDVIKKISNWASKYPIKDDKNIIIDEKYIKEHSKEDGYCNITFQYPREGKIIINY